MQSASTPAGSANTSVKGQLTSLTERYTRDVLHGELASTDPALHTLLRHLVVQLEVLWWHITAAGFFSANEQLEEYSTTALEMLWVPYVVGDLYQRIEGGSGGSVDPAPQRMPDEVNRSASNTADPRTAASAVQGEWAAREAKVANISRQEALTRSAKWFDIFFECLMNIELLTEKEVERYAVYRASQRTERVELARLCSDLKQKWMDWERKVGYARAKRRRMQELMAADGDNADEEGGEEEEALRERALARLRWSGYDACHQLQLSSRELEMLNTFSPEQRTAVSEEYQRTMDAVRRGELNLGRQTYTILPGNNMVIGDPQRPVAVGAEAVARAHGLSSVSLSALTSQQPFRQQVRDELMVDRNPTTQTLDEFAALEMAEVQRQMEQAAAMRDAQEAEDARVGPEGIEERERIKDSAWADWRDDNPVYGPTNKGNYA